jgi:hypothetical protein
MVDDRALVSVPHRREQVEQVRVEKAVDSLEHVVS